MTQPAANPTSPSGRALVIGLDMGDGTILREWSRRGRLPFFASAIEQAAWIDLESTAEVLHTSTWPTFATGTQPGRHGVYYPYQPRPGHQQAQLIEPDQYGTPTFWKRADELGRRCLVYDVPETFPEDDFGGRAIFEWGTWAWYGSRLSQPGGLLADLRRRFGDYPLGMEAKKLGLKIPDPAVVEKRLLACVEHKRETLQWLLDEQPWDLAVAAFCETHPAGHYLWPEAADGLGDSEEARFEPFFRVYQALDTALARLDERLPDDATLVVVSGDGVRPNRCGWHLLAQALEGLGYIGGGEDAPARRPSLLGRVKSAVPPGAKRWIADHLPWWLRDKLGGGMQSFDWAHTSAFPLPTDLEGCIRINVKGREPHGVVEPGEEYEDLCRRLRDDLEQLVCADTGEPAVRRVWVRSEVFWGELEDHLPDVVVTWNDAAPITSLASERLDRVGGPSPDGRTGTHSTEGFMLARGRSVPAGARGWGRLVDVAPTVLHLVGVEPRDMDGKSLDWTAATPASDGAKGAE